MFALTQITTYQIYTYKSTKYEERREKSNDIKKKKRERERKKCIIYNIETKVYIDYIHIYEVEIATKLS